MAGSADGHGIGRLVAAAIVGGGAQDDHGGAVFYGEKIVVGRIARLPGDQNVPVAVRRHAVSLVPAVGRPVVRGRGDDVQVLVVLDHEEIVLRRGHDVAGHYQIAPGVHGRGAGIVVPAVGPAEALGDQLFALGAVFDYQPVLRDGGPAHGRGAHHVDIRPVGGEGVHRHAEGLVRAGAVIDGAAGLGEVPAENAQRRIVAGPLGRRVGAVVVAGRILAGGPDAPVAGLVAGLQREPVGGPRQQPRHRKVHALAGHGPRVEGQRVRRLGRGGIVVRGDDGRAGVLQLVPASGNVAGGSVVSGGGPGELYLAGSAGPGLRGQIRDSGRRGDVRHHAAYYAEVGGRVAAGSAGDVRIAAGAGGHGARYVAASSVVGVRVQQVKGRAVF